MATKERLEQALRNADKAGDVAAAKRFAAAIRNGEYDQSAVNPSQPVVEQPKQESSFTDVVNEGMSALNRGGVGIVDALGSVIREPINAALYAADADYRIPTLRQSLANTPASVEGGQMADGLPKRVVRAAGELAPQSVAIGSAIRNVASAIPQTAQNSQNILPNIAAQMQGTTAGADAAYGALSGAGSEVGRELGGERGALIGSVAAPLASMAIAEAGKGVIRSLFGAKDGALATNILDDFASFGSTPTAGMVSGRQGLQGAENVSSKALGGAPLTKASDKIAENMQAKLNNIANSISSREGAETAGLQVQKGITGPGGFMDRFRQNSSVLWNKSDSLIDNTLPMPLTATRTKLNELVQSGNMGQILNNPKLAQIKDVLEQTPQVDYATARALRSSIGQKLASNDLASDIPRAELKQIYGALSNDIKELAANSSPEALKAFERANAFTRTGHERIDDHLQRIVNQVNPDKVFADLSRGGEGIKAIQTVKKSIPKEDWEVVAANVVRRLGRSTSGQQNAVGENALGDSFSINKFVTDWDKLGPAKKAIFSGSEKLDKYADNLNKIARAASVVKEAGLPSANASGSAQAASRYAAGSAAVGSAVTMNPTPILIAAGSVAMNNAGARLMTNPRFVALLANQGNKPLSKAFIGILAGLAKESSAQEAADIYELTKEFESKLEEQK